MSMRPVPEPAPEAAGENPLGLLQFTAPVSRILAGRLTTSHGILMDAVTGRARIAAITAAAMIAVQIVAMTVAVTAAETASERPAAR